MATHEIALVDYLAERYEQQLPDASEPDYHQFLSFAHEFLSAHRTFDIEYQVNNIAVQLTNGKRVLIFPFAEPDLPAMGQSSIRITQGR